MPSPSPIANAIFGTNAFSVGNWYTYAEIEALLNIGCCSLQQVTSVGNTTNTGIGFQLVSSSYTGTVVSGVLTANRIYTLPDKTDTFAMISDTSLQAVLTEGNRANTNLYIVDGSNNIRVGLEPGGEIVVQSTTGNQGVAMIANPTPSILFFDSSTNTYIVPTSNGSNTYTQTLQAATGTIALTSDITIYTATPPIYITSDVISITQSNTTTDGYLSSVDWNTFNNKQGSLNGTGIVYSTAGTISYINGSSSQYITGSGGLASYNLQTITSGGHTTTNVIYILDGSSNVRTGLTPAEAFSQDTSGNYSVVISANPTPTLSFNNSSTNTYIVATAGGSGSYTQTLQQATGTIALLSDISSYFSGTAPISVTSGVISISQATTSTNGYLSSIDWNTFNGKQAALSGTGVVVSASGTISYLSGTNTQYVRGDGVLDSYNLQTVTTHGNTTTNNVTFAQAIFNNSLTNTTILGNTITISNVGTTNTMVLNQTSLAYTTSGNTTTLNFTNPTATRTITFPDATGTVALVGSSAGVASVSNSDSSLTISPTTGAVVASLNVANANNWTALQTHTFNGIANTATDGIKLINTTAATSGTSQWSPALHFSGTSFVSSTTSETTDWRILTKPTNGMSIATGNLVFSNQENGGGYTDVVQFGFGGIINCGGVIAGNTNFSTTNSIITNNISGATLTLGLGSGTGGSVILQHSGGANAGVVAIQPLTAYTGTASHTCFIILPTWNTSGSSSDQDLVINRTETAVGSGIQRFISGQVAGTEYFGVDNRGTIIVSKTALTNTYTPALTLSNTTAATSGSQIQQSPSIYLSSNGWATGTTISVNSISRITHIPLPSSSNGVAGRISFDISNNAGSTWTNSMFIDSNISSLSVFGGAGQVLCGTIASGNNGVLTISGFPNASNPIVNITPINAINAASQGTNVAINTTFNQTSGSNPGTDLLISRTETALSTGTQRLISAGTVVSSTYGEKFGVSNTGAIYSQGTPSTGVIADLPLVYNTSTGQYRTMPNAGASYYNIKTITANYTTLTSDHTILVDTTSGNITITLAASTNQVLVIKRIGGLSTVTISGTIDGSSGYTIVSLYSFVSLQYDGTQWWII